MIYYLAGALVLFFAFTLAGVKFRKRSRKRFETHLEHLARAHKWSEYRQQIERRHMKRIRKGRRRG